MKIMYLCYIAAMVMILSILVISCGTSQKIKPLVYNGYVVVNNVIGFIRPIVNNQDTILSKIDLLLNAAETIKKALEIIVSYVHDPYIEQAYAISVEIVDILETIKNNPELVIDKIQIVISKLEDVRGTFVMIDAKLNLGIIFPEPRVLITEEELISSIEQLKTEINKK